MCGGGWGSAPDWVALRKESVDRNLLRVLLLFGLLVALRKESVDRNTSSSVTMVLETVALRKESVDRNPPRY